MKVEVLNNDMEKAIRQLRRKMMREGILKEMRTRTHYVKPSEERRRNHAAAVKRARRADRKAEISDV